ncbi:invasion associated locus B family protein [Rhizobium halophytocola]|uniref:Invasion protein IalB n=1 Tax=Rhizobium halophytocola TaxID=735519 RepID=A0ABS4E276_9HYPH|nr:invasion associated locus B family protein [Rhizobium halophytocola]MBP1852004.1 invasion protein IalB [Rhizobium halophytocola]
MTRSSHVLSRVVAAALLVFAAGAGALRAQDAVSLPGGAQSLSETHKDWTVTCGVIKAAAADGKRSRTEDADGVRACALTQRQVTEKKQNVLTVELQPDGAGMKGALVLPFGLSLPKGVSLQVDRKTFGKPLGFFTCLPAGCFVPLRLDAGMVAMLGKGQALLVLAADRTGKPLQLSISLAGFDAALQRVTALTN